MKGYLNRMLLAAAAVLLFASYPFECVYATELTNDEERLLQAYQRGEIIRLHIVANSNSADDQAIKLAVRDAIAAGFAVSYESNNSDEIFSYWKNNLDVLHCIAADTANNLGFSGTIETEAGIFMLPEKKYGSILLPEDNYKAIRITLGNAEGQNWWCVLYPQLCMSLTCDTEITPTEYKCSSARIFRLWIAVPF